MENRKYVTDIINKTSNNIAVFYDYFAKETRQRYGNDRIDQLLKHYTDDFLVLTREDELWGTQKHHADGGVGFHAEELMLADWDMLGEFLSHQLPETINRGVRLRKNSQKSYEARSEQYVVGHWWSLYFESLNFLRGAEQALYDIMLEQDNVRNLFDHLERYFFSLVDIYADVYKADAIWFGDDYGMQDRLMISPSLFKELFKPYIRRFAEKVHSKGMHLFMHTCGDIESIIPDIIDVGVDVLHPIQPGTMDAVRIAKTFGDDMTFFLGVDVQQIITNGTPTQIHDHIEELADCFSNHGFLLSCSNTIMPETPWENIEALFDAFSKIQK